MNINPQTFEDDYGRTDINEDKKENAALRKEDKRAWRNPIQISFNYTVATLIRAIATRAFACTEVFA